MIIVLITKILKLKKELSTARKTDSIIFGSGNYLIEHISDEFNEPLDEFNEYK